MDSNQTCIECAAPRSVCMNCDNPRCKHVVCNAHVNQFNKQYLCSFCYLDKFVSQRPRFVSVP